jgi:putative membrane protein insertion efficiency factor
MKREGLPRTQRLRRNAEIRDVLQKGKRSRYGALTLFFYPRGGLNLQSWSAKNWAKQTFATDISAGRGKHSGGTRIDLRQLEVLSYHLKVERKAINRLKTQFSKLTEWPSRIAVVMIDVYQATLGGVLGGQCRFYPSCSDYAKQAMMKYGLLRGAFKSTGRLVRCNPLNSGGVDEP